MSINDLNYDVIIIQQHSLSLNRFRVDFDEIIINVKVSYNSYSSTAKSTQHGYVLKGVYIFEEPIINNLIDFSKFLSIMQLFLKNQLSAEPHKVNVRLTLKRGRLNDEEIISLSFDKKKLSDLSKTEIQHYVNILNKFFNKLILTPLPADKIIRS